MFGIVHCGRRLRSASKTETRQALERYLPIWRSCRSQASLPISRLVAPAGRGQAPPAQRRRRVEPGRPPDHARSARRNPAGRISRYRSAIASRHTGGTDAASAVDGHRPRERWSIGHPHDPRRRPKLDRGGHRATHYRAVMQDDSRTVARLFAALPEEDEKTVRDGVVALAHKGLITLRNSPQL